MIRLATISDASRIAEILIFSKRTTYRAIFSNDKVSFNEMQVFPLANEYIENSEKLKDIYLYDDGIVKGMINLKNNDNELFIEELYIEPFFKGAGIGTALIEFAILKAKDENKNRISLWVLEKNLSAISFYKKQGFTYNGEFKELLGTGQNITKYTLSIK